MTLKGIINGIERGWHINKYPTADRNATIYQLFVQALPYFLYSSGYSRLPLSIFIHVNTKCNLKCKFCDAGQNNRESMFYKNLKGSTSSEMDLKNFKKIIDKVKHFRPFIGIPALEPTLYSEISEAISYIKRYGMRSSIATNGTMLEDMAIDFIEAGLTKIIISIDGPESHHDSIRGVPGTYRRVISGIKRLHELKKKYRKTEPIIYINYVIFEDNYDKLLQLVEHLPLSMIQQVDFRVMFFCTQEIAEKHNKIFGGKYDATSACLSSGINLYNIDISVLYDQIKTVRQKYGDKCKFFFKHGEKGLRRYYHQPELFLDDTRCVFPWYTMQINTDGTVIPPQRCYTNNFGNILDSDFEQIWNGLKMKQFRKDLKKYGRFPACTRCEGINY
jgi:MoaA/NifB/PqqE/SkfB family radical SAM enzyme